MCSAAPLRHSVLRLRGVQAPGEVCLYNRVGDPEFCVTLSVTWEGEGTAVRGAGGEALATALCRAVALLGGGTLDVDGDVSAVEATDNFPEGLVGARARRAAAHAAESLRLDGVKVDDDLIGRMGRDILGLLYQS